LGFLVVAAAIWSEFENETLARWAGTAIIVLAANLLVVTSLVLLREPRLLIVIFAEAFALGIAALIAIGAVWSDDFSEGAAKADAVFWVLGVLGWLLVPILQRFWNAPATEAGAGAVRVLASLDDVELVATRTEAGLDIRLAPGERLALRRRS
jgi:hypothetical protein